MQQDHPEVTGHTACPEGEALTHPHLASCRARQVCLDQEVRLAFCTLILRLSTTPGMGTKQHWPCHLKGDAFVLQASATHAKIGIIPAAESERKTEVEREVLTEGGGGQTGGDRRKRTGSRLRQEMEVLRPRTNNAD